MELKESYLAFLYPCDKKQFKRSCKMQKFISSSQHGKTPDLNPHQTTFMESITSSLEITMHIIPKACIDILIANIERKGKK